MARRVVERIVDAHDDVQCALILHRGSDDHTLHAAVEICLKLFWPEELASAFENDIAAKICPGDEARRNLRTEAEILLPDCDPLFHRQPRTRCANGRGCCRIPGDRHSLR